MKKDVNSPKFYYIELNLMDVLLMERIEQAAFERFGCLGSQDYSIDEEKVDEILGERSYSGGNLPESVIAEMEQFLSDESQGYKKLFFNDYSSALEFRDFLNEEIDGIHIEIKNEVVQDWNEKWKESFKEIEVTKSFSIIPSWIEKANGRDNYIKIYPGMGFGTGNHETTWLCLKLFLESVEWQNVRSCLDFGCGSGILGIGYSQMVDELTIPLSSVDYYDIDDEALENCRHNISLNPKAMAITHRVISYRDKNNLRNDYDLVFANILQGALLQEKDILLAQTQDWLILSGLLIGQEKEVVESFRSSAPELELIKIVRKGDWCAVLMRKV